MAWKRGWKVLYQPRSVVYHEHRGTIGKRFSEAQIQAVLKKNYLLFCWKNIHEWRRLAAHFFFAWAGAVLSVVFGDVPGRAQSRRLRGARSGSFRGAVRSRWRARGLAADGRYGGVPASAGRLFPRPLRRHGRPRRERSARAVRFAVSHLPAGARRRRVHVPDAARNGAAGRSARGGDAGLALAGDGRTANCASSAPRPNGWCGPAAGPKASARCAARGARVRQRRSGLADPPPDLSASGSTCCNSNTRPWRSIAGEYRRIATALFEHDVYFQSIARGLGHMIGVGWRRSRRASSICARCATSCACCRDCDQVQVCTPANRDYLLSFLPRARARAARGAARGHRYRRATASARAAASRSPCSSWAASGTTPIASALDWFVREVLPLILARQPGARLVVAGSDPPPAHAYADHARALEMLGYVEDVREPLARYAVFVCPILSGSGVRVKLLEAFAAGIPVVSTRDRRRRAWRARTANSAALADDSGGLRGTRAGNCSRIPARPLRWPRAPAPKWKRNWDMAAITRGWWRVIGELVQNAKRSAVAHRYFRSRLRRLTMSEAVRSSSLELESLGNIEYRPDHLPRFGIHQEQGAFGAPKSRSHGRIIELGALGRSFCRDCRWRDLLGLLVLIVGDLLRLLRALGVGETVSSWSRSESPTRSLKTASASLGSVTTRKTWSLVSRLARYWSRP